MGKDFEHKTAAAAVERIKGWGVMGSGSCTGTSAEIIDVCFDGEISLGADVNLGCRDHHIDIHGLAYNRIVRAWELSADDRVWGTEREYTSEGAMGGLLAAQFLCMMIMMLVFERTEWKLQARKAQALTRAVADDDEHADGQEETVKNQVKDSSDNIIFKINESLV
ncbi:hypothetical protein NE237_019033 [Protea cynaroides]|uniref:Uncharacterized protein n=1 Tax=Protea cynaroides TaxID=273540 RepID=A0A9Q0QPQ3_9MAGN|nr:hypothetical protein NE237_019033 [Protea cynaroides]